MTTEEKQALLVSLARELGFKRAGPATWLADDPEHGGADYDDLCNESGPGCVTEIDLGIFLRRSVFVVTVDDELGMNDYVAFDTKEEAEQRAAAAKAEQERNDG